MAGKRGFGSIRKLPSGAFQARYTGPDGAVHKAAHTFQTKGDADAWLARQCSTSSGEKVSMIG